MSEEKKTLKNDDLLETGHTVAESVVNSEVSYGEIDPVAERRLLWKLDILLLPLFTLICQFTYYYLKLVSSLTFN